MTKENIKELYEIENKVVAFRDKLCRENDNVAWEVIYRLVSRIRAIESRFDPDYKIVMHRESKEES